MCCVNLFFVYVVFLYGLGVCRWVMCYDVIIKYFGEVYWCVGCNGGVSICNWVVSEFFIIRCVFYLGVIWIKCVVYDCGLYLGS